LLGVMTVIVVLLAVWRNEVEPYRKQSALVEFISSLGGSFTTAEGDPWQLWLLGDNFVNVVSVDLSEASDPDAYLPRVVPLPRLATLTVGGEEFGDEQLARLDVKPLRHLVLDTTSVSEAALAAWQKRRPRVEVSRTGRRAIASLEACGFHISANDDSEF